MGNELKCLEEISSFFKAIPSRVTEAIAELFSEYGIDTLGIWNSHEEWRSAKYNQEDMEILGHLKPEFDGMVGWTFENLCYSNGPIIAVKYNRDENNVILIMADDDCDEIIKHSLSEYQDFGIIISELLDAVVNSVKFNLNNSVPVEKWGLNHYPSVDPYSYEYLEYDEDGNEEIEA